MFKSYWIATQQQSLLQNVRDAKRRRPTAEGQREVESLVQHIGPLRSQGVTAGMNCIKIGLPGQLIFSKRKGLLEGLFSWKYYLRIAFPGRPIYIQLPPVVQVRGGVGGGRVRLSGKIQHFNVLPDYYNLLNIDIRRNYVPPQIKEIRVVYASLQLCKKVVVASYLRRASYQKCTFF